MEFTYQGKKYTLILFVLSGSRFYNTQYELGEHPFFDDYVSDYDYKGVYIASNEDKIGLGNKPYHCEIQPKKEELSERSEILSQINSKLNKNIQLDGDFTLYEIKTFVEMAQKGNPNILDILFSDDESTIYNSTFGKELTKNKYSFLSKRLEISFSKYGQSQMYKMMSHYKMIGKYPEVTKVSNAVKLAFSNGDIDYQWIVENFSGDLASFTTGITQEDFNQSPNKKEHTLIRWEEFSNKYCSDIDNIDKYHRALMIDYVKVKDLKGNTIPLNTFLADTNYSDKFIDIYNFDKKKIDNPTIRDFLLFSASFKMLGENIYNIFTAPDNKYNGGIFSMSGINVKNSAPKEVGEFLFSIIVNKNDLKVHQDEIKKLWNWKTHRNEKRSVLEEAFGYDTKKASHLIRLLRSSKNIFLNNTYNPRLYGDDLKIVKNVLNGKYTYDEVMSMSKNLSTEIKDIVKTSKLPVSVNFEVANSILIKILNSFYLK